MNKEFIAAISCIILMFVGLAAGLSVLVFLAACATIIIGCYSAYYYKGEKNCWYSLGVIGSFILFVASSSYPGGIICTLLMFVFLGVVLYFAWYAEKKETNIPDIKPGTLMAYCSKCGALKAAHDQFCPNCGAKIDNT